MLSQLGPEDRVRLVKFVCSFAWTDLEVRPAEREFIAVLMDRLGLAEKERELVRGWIQVPPTPEEVDPTDVPREHRQLFLDALRAVASIDGQVSEEEIVSLSLFEQLVV